MKNLNLKIGQVTTLDEIFTELNIVWSAIAFEDLINNASVDNYDGNAGVNVCFDVVENNDTEEWITIVKITDIYNL